ncbi:MAG: MATE family efflux transporter [Candidatus Omnitrophica bacterium]|nr:MATE family efflux transporter [Candidatus Omnitrophota bacterium]
MNSDNASKIHTLSDIARESWSVSWPMTFIMFYEFLIGLADIYVAGRFGKTAQAAYGFSFQLYFVFIIIGIALSIGTVSVVSRLYSAERTHAFRSAVASCVGTSAALGIIFVILGFFLSGNIISGVNIPLPVKSLAIPFMRIYSLAFLFDYVLMNNNGILRACGMVKRSLWVMTIVCMMNIALNFLLAFRTPLGLNGIAVATVISLFTGAALTLYFTGRLSGVFSFSIRIVKEVLNISWPSGLLQAFLQIGYLVLFLILGMLPRYNTEIMAALTNGLKIESAIFLPAIAFNLGAAVIVGRHLGIRDKQGAFRGGVITAVMGVAMVIAIILLVMLNARHVASFLSDNPIVTRESVKYIHIALIGQPFLAWGLILAGGLNGAGDTRSVMLIMFISIWLIRIPLCYYLGIELGLGAVSIWWSMNISIIVHAILMTYRYWQKRWISMGMDVAV